MEQEKNTTVNQSDNESLVIGNSSNFWRFSFDDGFDLTRASHKGNFIRFDTTTVPITIDPDRCALVIIDMQNFFINPVIRTHETGLAASKKLLETVLPTARKISMQVIWLNWGLTEEDIDEAPPSLKRAFGMHMYDCKKDDKSKTKTYKGLGEPMGKVELSDGKLIEVGRLLMRNTWNTSLYDPLLESYNGSQSNSKPDLWFHKNRISGLWAHESPILSYFRSNKIATLFLAGVNTDQCVSGTLQDALSKGFDCILLRDACGTTSPSFAQQCTEYNCALSQGFVMDVEAFAKGVDQFQ